MESLFASLCSLSKGTPAKVLSFLAESFLVENTFGFVIIQLVKAV